MRGTICSSHMEYCRVSSVVVFKPQNTKRQRNVILLAAVDLQRKTFLYPRARILLSTAQEWNAQHNYRWSSQHPHICDTSSPYVRSIHHIYSLMVWRFGGFNVDARDALNVGRRHSTTRLHRSIDRLVDQYVWFGWSGGDGDGGIGERKKHLPGPVWIWMNQPGGQPTAGCALCSSGFVEKLSNRSRRPSLVSNIHQATSSRAHTAGLWLRRSLALYNYFNPYTNCINIIYDEINT